MRSCFYSLLSIPDADTQEMWSTGLVSTTSLIIQRKLTSCDLIQSGSLQVNLHSSRLTLGSGGASIDTMEKNLLWPPVSNAWQCLQIIVLVWWVTGHGWKPFILLGLHHDARLYTMLDCYPSSPPIIKCLF